MNKEEIESLIKQLKAAGLDEEQIMETFSKHSKTVKWIEKI